MHTPSAHQNTFYNIDLNGWDSSEHLNTHPGRVAVRMERESRTIEDSVCNHCNNVYARSQNACELKSMQDEQ